MEEIAKHVATNYGPVGLALFGLGLLAYQIGNRMVAALDRLTARSDANAQDLLRRNEENSKAMAISFSAASKEISDSVVEHAMTTAQRVGDLSERIARVESRLNIEEPTPVQVVSAVARISGPKHRTNG